jgi:hypothetical protein
LQESKENGDLEFYDGHMASLFESISEEMTSFDRMLEILQTHTHLCKTLKWNLSKYAVSIDGVAKFW